MMFFASTDRTVPEMGACKIAPSAFGAGSPSTCPAVTRSPAFTCGTTGVPALCFSGSTSRLTGISARINGAGKS